MMKNEVDMKLKAAADEAKKKADAEAKKKAEAEAKAQTAASPPAMKVQTWSELNDAAQLPLEKSQTAV